jgi:hypothetical protein
MTKPPTLEVLLDAAERHGEQSEPEHEAGDLQAIVRSCWALLTPEQRAQVLAEHEELIADWGHGTYIPDDSPCAVCERQPQRRTCDSCGVSACITDCGHLVQPRPIAADNMTGHAICAACFDRREEAP